MTRNPLRRAGVAAAVAFGLGFGLGAMAASPVQNAPFTTPTYTPTTSAAKLLYTAPGTYVFNTLGNGALSFQFSGGASFAAQLQATVDGTNWTTLPAWPAGGGAPVQTVSANGLYSVPVAGYTQNLLRRHSQSADADAQVRRAEDLSMLRHLAGHPAARRFRPQL